MAQISLSLFCLAVCFMLAIGATSVKRSELQGDSSLQEMSQQKLAINRLMHRLLDTVEQTYRDLGATDEELSNMKRKRGYVTACYFSSITCY